jgi:hypothetical protein
VFELTSLFWGALPILDGKVGFTNWVRRSGQSTTDDSAEFIAQIRGFLQTSK